MRNKYITIKNGDYLPPGAFAIPPRVNGGKVTLAATSGGRSGDGTLAVATFKVLAKKDSTIKLTAVKLSNADANPLAVSTQDGTVTGPVKISIDPATIASPEVGQELEIKVQITGGKGVAGYQFTLSYDQSCLLYTSDAADE